MTKRDKLVLEHLHIVKIIARKVHSKNYRWADLDDLIQSGNIGLLIASRKFDFKSENKFKTYAEYYIYGSIIDFLRSENILGRVVLEELKKIDYASDALSVLGKKSTTKEISKLIGLSEKRIHAMRLLHSSTKSISIVDNDMFSVREKDSLFKEALKFPDSFDLLKKKEILKKLENSILSLNSQEQIAVTLYYFNDTKLKEVGRLLRVSESRAHQIIGKALEKLRDVIDFELKDIF